MGYILVSFTSFLLNRVVRDLKGIESKYILSSLIEEFFIAFLCILYKGAFLYASETVKDEFRPAAQRSGPFTKLFFHCQYS